MIFILGWDSHEPQDLTIWYQNAEIIPNGKILGELQLKAHSSIFNKSQANSYHSHRKGGIFQFNLLLYVILYQVMM